MSIHNLDDVLNEFLSDGENFETYIETAMAEYMDGESENIQILKGLAEAERGEGTDAKAFLKKLLDARF